MLKVDVLALVEAKKAELVASLDQIKAAVDSISEVSADADLQKKIEELVAEVALLKADKDALALSLQKDEEKITKALVDLGA